MEKSDSFPQSAQCTQAKTAADLAYADGVVYEALREEKDGVGGKRVIFPQQQRQQVCGHVLELPGPEDTKQTYRIYIYMCCDSPSVTHIWSVEIHRCREHLQLSVFKAVQEVID